jgi:hypothetical protein
MTEQMQENRNQRPDNYTRFVIALALGMTISAVALFSFEYFGVIDVITCWP